MIPVMLLVLTLPGCAREYYRLQTDREVACLVHEKSADPRWGLPNFNINVDARSRYADVYDPDRPPMPPDDPASHQFMHRLDGKKHWDEWHDNGDIEELENPYWREYLNNSAVRNEEGEIVLTLEDSVQLALIHSPNWQEQLETLYFSALDVSSERFRYDVQFFGGTGVAFSHLSPDRPGGGSSLLSVTNDAGGGFGGNRAVLNRRLATGGQLLVDFANSFTWQFFGPDSSAARSTLGFTFLQPLLRAGGREVELERLTITERALLANLRSLQRYRQGFYTRVAIGELGVTGPRRRGGFQGGTGLTGFSGQGGGGFGGVGEATGFGRTFGGGGATGGGAGGGAGFAGGGAGAVDGFMGLLQQLQQIRNTEDSLGAQLQTLALLESSLEAGLIDIAQVDQFRQNIETERANLIQAKNGLATALDSFKRSTLGLPPNLEVSPDDTMIRPFQLIPPDVSGLQARITQYISQFGDLPEQPTDEQLESAFTQVWEFADLVGKQLKRLPTELQKLDEVLADRVEDSDHRLLESERKRMDSELADLHTRLDDSTDRMQKLTSDITDEKREAIGDGVVEVLNEVGGILGEGSLVQARARLEMITVESIDLTSEAALQIASANRLDWMNNRAALVDSWRLIEFNANALKSDVSIRFDGDVSTSGRNPVKFEGQTGALGASLQIDPPLTRLLERNSFRQQLVEYQQARRQMIQFEDRVMQNIRDLIRGLEQLRVNLEIQRRAVAIAIRRVDQTREALNQPVPPALPGQLPQAFGPTLAQNLLFALSDLRNTQNNLMSVWLNYHARRMQLYRELGVMQIDENGLWVDCPLSDAVPAHELHESCPQLPPRVPGQWLQQAREIPHKVNRTESRPRSDPDPDVASRHADTTCSEAREALRGQLGQRPLADESVSHPFPARHRGISLSKPAAPGGDGVTRRTLIDSSVLVRRLAGIPHQSTSSGRSSDSNVPDRVCVQCSSTVNGPTQNEDDAEESSWIDAGTE